MGVHRRARAPGQGHARPGLRGFPRPLRQRRGPASGSCRNLPRSPGWGAARPNHL